MLLEIPYGKTFLKIELAGERLDIVNSKPLRSIASLKNRILHNIRKPIQSKPLNSLSSGKKICIIVPDKTRACPIKGILQPVLEELETCRPKELKILIGTGLHDCISKRESFQLFGENLVEKYEIFNHIATDEEELVDLGIKTSYGTPTIVNKILKQSDYIIGIGLVEPHFFAGYSGGRKSILPAVSGKEAIFKNHSYRMIAHKNASYGVLDGNPIHLDMIEFMEHAGLSFIVNVTTDNKGGTSGVFAGDPIEAHRHAVKFLNRHVNVKLCNLADIVIVSNGGYPLDRDLYQAVKGISTARRAIKDEGVIILLAECEEGLGGHEEFGQLMRKAENPKDVLKEIRENEPIIDQWQAQVLATILLKANVIFVTDEANLDILRKMNLKYSRTLDEALNQAKRIISSHNPKIVAIPEGPYVIPNLL